MAVFVKQNDTAPALVYTLQDNVDSSPTAIDLTNATGVTFKMRLASASASTAPAVDEAMTVTDAAGGEVTYEWQAGDTAVTGEYEGEFEIAWNDGTIETVPNGADSDAQYVTIHVVEDLDADV